MPTRSTGGGGGGGSAPSIVILGNFGAKLTMTYISELITIAAAPTSISIANLIPGNAFIMGCVLRVVTAIPTATLFDVAITTDATTLMAGVSVALNTTDTMFANQQLAPFFNPTARTVTITPNGTPAAATGQVRFETFYWSLTPPTS